MFRVPALIACGTIALALGPGESAAGEKKPEGVFFAESFDDAGLAKRGWYDGTQFRIVGGARAGKGCIEYEWTDGASKVQGSSPARHSFEPSDEVAIRFYLKLSKGWGWSGQNFHPHLTHFLTTENTKWHGPAASHLTLYVEPVGGKLRLAAQDIQNAAAPHGLTQGPLRGGYNGKLYDSDAILFNDDRWHYVEAYFKLNTLDLPRDRPNPDGVVRGWLDGKLVVDRTDVVLRSTDFPKMKFNQFLMAPYFGPGLLPHAQKLWIDELVVGPKRIGPLPAWTAIAGAAPGVAQERPDAAGDDRAGDRRAADDRAVDDLLAGRFQWRISQPLLAPADRPEDPCYSVKDPSVVFFGGRWHLFLTIRSQKRSHQVEYLSFADWKEAGSARRHLLKAGDGFFCAPQVFYFAPQKKWYLICQASDKAWTPEYGAAYSTTSDLADPDSWSKLRPLGAKQAQGKNGLDFWILCDDRKAHLFFTTLDGRMWREETRLEDFPGGWSEAKLAIQGDIFEASHTYRLKGLNKYLTVVEAQGGHGWRYFKAYLADGLEGPWTPLAATKDNAFASMANARPIGPRWTDSISHGELLRAGVDQRLEVDPAKLRFLFQGVSDQARDGKPYGQIPWRLGLLERDTSKRP